MADDARGLEEILGDIRTGDSDRISAALEEIPLSAQGQLDRVRPDLLTVMSGDDPVPRFLAANALAQLGDSSDFIVEVLASYLGASESFPAGAAWIFWYRALESLSGLRGNPNAADLLVKTSQHNQDPRIRTAAIRALGALGDEATRELLEDLARQGEDQRRAAWAALDCFGTATFSEIHARSEELKEEEERQRRRCLVAGAIYGEKSQEVKLLRWWRDSCLRAYLPGRSAIAAYELTCPLLAAVARRSRLARRLMRLALVAPAVRMAKRAMPDSRGAS